MKSNEPHHIAWKIGLGIGLCCSLAIVVRYFLNRVDYSVFDSPDLPGSGACINPNLLKKLQQLQRKTGFPVFDWINSGARSPAHNRKVGGVSNSAHLMPQCYAVDIHVPNHQVRQALVKAAKEVGFTRIGVANTFLHLDVDPTKKQFVAWGYPAGSPPPINPFV